MEMVIMYWYHTIHSLDLIKNQYHFDLMQKFIQIKFSVEYLFVVIIIINLFSGYIDVVSVSVKNNKIVSAIACDSVYSLSSILINSCVWSINVTSSTSGFAFFFIDFLCWISFWIYYHLIFFSKHKKVKTWNFGIITIDNSANNDINILPLTIFQPKAIYQIPC